MTPDTEQKGQLKAEIGAATYIVPPTVGVDGAPAATAGATPTDPGSAPAGGSASTTTATITGVR